MLVDLEARLFRAAYRCTATEPTRFYLQGVHVERHPAGGALLVATDGRHLVAIRDTSANLRADWINQTIRVDKATLAACKKTRSEKQERRIFIADRSAPLTVERTDRAAIQATCHAWEMQGGTFPDWRRVVPTPDMVPTSRSVAYDTRFLDNFGKIATDLGHPAPVVILTGSKDGPGYVHIRDEEERFFGVIMPVSFRGVPGDIPDWLGMPQSKRRKKKAA